MGRIMSTPAPATARAEIVVDLDALRHNVRTLKDRIDGRALMVVVKADGYGHGMLEVARVARESGADWLGVAFLEEALALREAGDTGPQLGTAAPWLRPDATAAAPATFRKVRRSILSVRNASCRSAICRSCGL
jgi:alanine racemase